jgi:hypothetical protein
MECDVDAVPEGTVVFPGGQWENKVKLSEQVLKISTPGVQQVRRFRSATLRQPAWATS